MTALNILVLRFVTRLGLVALVCSVTTSYTCAALQIDECVSGSVEVVKDSASFNLTCSGYSASATWAYQVSPAASNTFIGHCSSSSCTLASVLPPGYFTLSFVGSTSSRLTSTATRTSDGEGFIYSCAPQGGSVTSCKAVLIVKAIVSSCDLQVTSDWPWKVTGSCNVSKVFSPLNGYRCTVFQGTSQALQTTQVASVSYNVTPAEPGYYRGSCSFTANLPVTTANYFYRIVVYPGATENLRDPINVVRASSPNITSCTPKNYVPENTSVTCRCTANVGQPAGRLVWKRIQSSGTVINTANYGDTVLNMTPQMLIRNDHNVTKFRCDVQWAEDVEGDTYTASVGYGPEDTVLRLNSMSTNLTVQENATVVFHCQGNGRPTPDIVLTNQDSGLDVNRSQSSPLTHTVSRARCEDAAVYTCIASNDVGPDQRDTRTLYVKCKPRSELPQLPTMNFDDQTVTQTFQVIAYPVPDQFTFTFLGPNMTSCSPREEVKDTQLSAICASTPGVLYRSTCTLTVSNVSSPSAAGFYSIRVANTEGHQDFTFQLSAQSSSNTDGPSSYFGLAVGLGVGLGVALAVIVTCNVCVILWLWRRGWRLPCADWSRNTTGGVGARNSSSFGESSATDADIQGGPYDCLKMQDVGLRSPYAEISHGTRQDSEDSKDKSSLAGAPADPPVYQNKTFY